MTSIASSCARCCACANISAALMLVLVMAPAMAGHIATNRDANRLRGSLPGAEGYLSHVSINIGAPGGGGEERTGWTDIRHPANDGTALVDPGSGNNLNGLTNTNFGFDRSDHWVNVHSVVVRDGTPAAISAMPNIARDFNFANQIYAQLGISVHSVNPVVAQYGPNVTFPINGTPAPNAAPGGFEVDTIAAANRAAAPAVNSYYIRNFNNNSPVGFAITPEDTIAPNLRPNTGLFIADNINNDTMAHELGHFLVDNYRYAGGAVHSPNNTDLMATSTGGFRMTPNANIKGNGNAAPSQPGMAVGNIGGRDLFGAPMDIPPLPGGGPATAQIHAIYDAETDGNTYVQVVDNGLVAADQADFDWVEDNIPIELADRPGVDDRSDNHDGIDFLVFRVGSRAVPTHTGHNHGAWGTLAGGTFAGTIRTIDVFSQIAVYADQDVDPTTQNWSPRESALDYNPPQFSADGLNWMTGTLHRVFTQGWTAASNADDYVARWVSPIGAQYVRIQAAPLGGSHDGNTQIDAIIASSIAVPEPATIVLCGVLASLMVLGTPRRYEAVPSSEFDRERTSPS